MWKITFRQFCFLVSFLIIPPGSFFEVSAQEIANSVIYSDNVKNPQNAIIFEDSFATLNSNSGLVLGLGAKTGILELSYPETLSAGTTSYIRLDFEDDILNTLLQGSLGELIADISSTLILGNHYFRIQPKFNNSVLATYATDSFESDSNFRIVTDNMGNYYAAITPVSAYNRIKIEDITAGILGLSNRNSMDVYYVQYGFNNLSDCYKPAFTSANATGINLDALGLGNAGGKKP